MAGQFLLSWEAEKLCVKKKQIDNFTILCYVPTKCLKAYMYMYVLT